MGKHKFIDKAAKSLELPADVLGGAVRITIIGQEYLKLSNHRGIIIYQPEQIVLRLAMGKLQISGQGLHLTELTDEQIVVEGQLTAIAFMEVGDEE